MKIFFIGSVSFSRKALQKLLSLDAEVVGVATKSKSAFNADHSDLSDLCIRENINWKYVKDINAPHIVNWIAGLSPDIIFCFGWSSLIKKELLELTPLGVIGFHPTCLPENRGRHPLIWTLALGLKKGATTFFFMEEGADDGDILSQKSFDVDYFDDASNLYKKTEKNALSQIEEFYPHLKNGSYIRKPQTEQGNIWRKRGMKDGEIDFRMSSYAIYNLVRALSKPYVGAHLIYKNKEVKVWKVKEETCYLTNIEPGKVLESVGKEILVKTYTDAVRIIEHEFLEIPQKGEYL